MMGSEQTCGWLCSRRRRRMRVEDADTCPQVPSLGLGLHLTVRGTVGAYIVQHYHTNYEAPRKDVWMLVRMYFVYVLCSSPSGE